jgi:hypothetical protein
VTDIWMHSSVAAGFAGRLKKNDEGETVLGQYRVHVHDAMPKIGVYAQPNEATKRAIAQAAEQERAMRRRFEQDVA